MTELCGKAYDSHEWQIDDKFRSVCALCGLVDLRGSRIHQRVLDGLRRRGLLLVLVLITGW